MQTKMGQSKEQHIKAFDLLFGKTMLSRPGSLTKI